MTTAEAWTVRRRAHGDPERAVLERTTVDIGTVGPDEALVQPLFGSWEANMTHVLRRQPIDICAARGEERVVVGNAATVKVIEVGRDVDEVEPGQHAILFSAGEIDDLGYMTLALAYDAPGQMGCAASRMRLKGRQLVPVPENSRHSLAQWSSFGVRYVTAWANWLLALRVARFFRDEASHPVLNVWGWGGGTTLAELDLAHRQGHACAMLSGKDENLEAIAKLGFSAVDRREFGKLHYEASMEPEQRAEYLEAENAFADAVDARTDGEGVHVFVDFIGLPVWRATRRVLARESVVTTAGWKQGMKLDFLRASECIGHRQFVHTHFALRHQAVEAVAFAEAENWIAPEPTRLYGFDELPELAAAYEAGSTGYFPCYEIDPT